MVTEVDVEGRHEDLPSLRNELESEKKHIASQRDLEIEERAKKLEADLAELEADGAKADARRKVKDGAEREMGSIRKRADQEMDRLSQVFDRFIGLKVQDLEGDELLYREMSRRYGPYFKGSMGAEAIQKRLQSFDLVAEAEKLREIIATGKGQRKTRALKRLKVVNAFLTTTNSATAMVLDCVRSSRRICAPWSSWTVVASRHRISTTSTVA
jgi:DNA-directed RNA polymerase subunit beta'